MSRYAVVGLGLLLMLATADAAEDLETAYKARIRFCTGNASGTMRVLGATVSADLKPRLPTLNLPRYCECYWGRLRDSLGLKTMIYMTSNPQGKLEGDPENAALRDFQNTYTGTWNIMRTQEQSRDDCVRQHSQRG
jgi:hypothetical protein